MALNRIETEARRLLLERRDSLWRSPAQAPAGPGPEAPVAMLLPGPEQRELADIDEALARIAAGEYGNCLSCGGVLGLQRIRAIPEARYCIGCASTRGAS